MKRIIQQILEFHLNIKYFDINPGMKFADDLDVDSLDCIEICMDIEDQLAIEITDEELEAINTVQDLYDLVYKKQAEKPVNQMPLVLGDIGPVA